MKGTITTKDLLKIVTDLSQDNIDLVSKLVKKMSENQLNWRPNSGVSAELKTRGLRQQKKSLLVLHWENQPGNQ